MIRALGVRASVHLSQKQCFCATRRAALFHTTPLRHDEENQTHLEVGQLHASTAEKHQPLPVDGARSFVAREAFNLPSTTPSWFAGHMARAIRSMPYLLARYPPPLVIEARDARLPLTSINPVFEDILRKAPTANDGLDEFHAPKEDDAAAADESSGRALAAKSAAAEISTWRSRRLIVYLKRDLINPVLEAPILEAMAKRDPLQTILFVDTRVDADVKKVIHWVQKQARKIAADSTISSPPKVLSEYAEKKAKKGLSGAFRHTATPDEGIRLLILGMPNVGKSSLLNGLRRVGTGKGKAASTAPHPGHTRKLTGTVRISKEGPAKVAPEPRGSGRRSAAYREQMDPKASKSTSKAAADSFVINPSADENEMPANTALAAIETARKEKPKSPPIYVYDTPGVMVPFLGHGSLGAERGIKLAITAGIKDSLFDLQLLADYLLFRLNQRAGPTLSVTDASESGNLVSYAQNLPLPAEYLSNTASTQGRTNSVEELLWYLAAKAPGSLKKGNIRDLDLAAQFMLQHWRLGKLDANTELDLNTTDPNIIRQRIGDFLDRGMSTTDPAHAAHAQDFSDVSNPASSMFAESKPDYSNESRTQAKKLEHKRAVLARKNKALDKRAALRKANPTIHSALSSRTGSKRTGGKRNGKSGGKPRRRK